MKINVQANDFCPDNCPYCEIERQEYFYGTEIEVDSFCKNIDICKHAVAKQYEKGVFEGYTKGYDAGRKDTFSEVKFNVQFNVRKFLEKALSESEVEK